MNADQSMDADTLDQRAEGRPMVSIIIPVHNDEEHVARSIDSALAQTRQDFEVVCVDDASTDGTCEVIESYSADPRVRLIRHQVNSSAFQARRTGIHAARAPYILFLDGDDELVRDAVEITLARAESTSADVVGFGVEFVMPHGHGAPRFARSLQPNHTELVGAEIIPSLFPEGRAAQGHLWRYLFKVEVLRSAYDGFGSDVAFYRANDIPITFRALSFATKYVSTKEKLYRYFFRRGTSGQAINSVEDFVFYLKAVDSIESIGDKVVPPGGGPSLIDPVEKSYRSARRSIIGNVLRYILDRTSGSLQKECLALLVDRVGEIDVVLAAADFCRDALPLLVDAFEGRPVPATPEVRSVVLSTSHLRTGGLQGVVVAQAEYLLGEGIDVTVAVHHSDQIAHMPPGQAGPLKIEGGSWAGKIQSLLEICATAKADVIIDHHILYNEYWPFYALAARAAGIGTIGWLHNFALRPTFDGSTRMSFLLDNISVLRTVAVLSATDVTFWAINGFKHAVHLPNPPSPLVLDLHGDLRAKERDDSPIKLVWWGRMQEATKQVTELVKVAKELRERSVDFRLSIVGPDGPDLTREKILSAAQDAGVADVLHLPGPLHGQELVDLLRSADMSLMTSAIEGYPLTLVESQALGLPVVMYELPWIALRDGDVGVFEVPQGDARGMAERIEWLATDRARYDAASKAGVEAARRTLALDFGKLYRELVEDRLPREDSPSTTADISTLMRLSVLYSERTAKALASSRADLRRIEAAPAASGHSGSTGAKLPDIEQFRQYRLKKSSRFLQILSRALPSTWRQANILAERQAKWHRSALVGIVQEQNEIGRTVRGLESALRQSHASHIALEGLVRDALRELKED